MARQRIFSFKFTGMPIDKASETRGGSMFGAPGVKGDSPIVLRTSALPGNWSFTEVGYTDGSPVVTIQHSDSGAWAYVSSNAQEGSLVLTTMEPRKCSQWQMKMHDDDQQTIHLKTNMNLLWGLESGVEGSKVMLRTDVNDPQNRWIFEGLGS